MELYRYTCVNRRKFSSFLKSLYTSNFRLFKTLLLETSMSRNLCDPKRFELSRFHCIMFMRFVIKNLKCQYCILKRNLIAPPKSTCSTTEINKATNFRTNQKQFRDMILFILPYTSNDSYSYISQDYDRVSYLG